MFFKCLNLFEPATSCTAQTLCAKLLSYCKKFVLEFFSCTTARYLLGQHVKISGALCMNLAALGARNALWSVESSIQVQFRDFF